MKGLIAVLTVIFMIGAGTMLYWEAEGPESIASVYQEYDNERLTFPNLHPGDEVPVAGIITGIETVQTTAGEIKVVMLDGAPLSQGIIVPLDSDSRIGEQFTTTLHFKEMRYNNDTVVSAEELYGPIPYVPMTMANVMQDVNCAATHLLLVPKTVDRGIELTVFETVFEPHGGYPLELFCVTLGVGRHFGLDDAWDLQLNSYDRLDYMDELGKPSESGIIEFRDGTSPGRLNGGDVFILHLTPTGDNTSHRSYYLMLNASGVIEVTKYLLMGGAGLVEYITEPSYIQIKPVSDDSYGAGRRLVMMVSCSVGSNFASYRTYDWEVYFDSGRAIEGALGTAPFVSSNPDEPTFKYLDVNGNGVLDYPDTMEIGKTVPLKEYRFRLERDTSPDDHGLWESVLVWISGLGACPLASTFVMMSSNLSSLATYRVNIDELYGRPGVEYLMRYVRVALSGNGTELINDTVVNGTIGGNASALNFTDANSNGYIDPGDFFTLAGQPGIEYYLKLGHGREMKAEWRS